MNFQHKSVLLNECIENLNIDENGIYVDGTMGGGGHSLEIAKKLSLGKLICIDQDINAHTKAKEVLQEHLNKIIFVHDNFSNIKNILLDLGITKINGMLLDLGVSSHQLDEGERGFSFHNNGRLDMRMDRRQKLDAYEVVNNYSKEDLTRIFYEYGEESWSKRIAEFIVEERKSKAIEYTEDLVEVIKKAIPKKAREKSHPAKKVFQAIRIEVNNELGIIEDTIEDIVDFLDVEGRLLIITFHSLEDRIVKNKFRQLNDPCTCPREFPVCICKKEKKVEILNRKPIIPSAKELEDNKRSRSSKLRIIERI